MLVANRRAAASSRGEAPAIRAPNSALATKSAVAARLEAIQATLVQQTKEAAGLSAAPAAPSRKAGKLVLAVDPVQRYHKKITSLLKMAGQHATFATDGFQVPPRAPRRVAAEPQAPDARRGRPTHVRHPQTSRRRGPGYLLLPSRGSSSTTLARPPSSRENPACKFHSQPR